MNENLRLDRFDAPLDAIWEVTEIGGAAVRMADGRLHLTNPSPLPGTQRPYVNAQIADYAYPSRAKTPFAFRWRPPVRLTVRAYASSAALRGTAGFGFWNHPFSPDVKRPPRLPQAVWFFFSSPPNDMQLAYGVPGPGWKAATIDATRPAALMLAPFALPAVLLMRAPRLYAALWPFIQRRLRIGEHPLDPALLTEPHTYTLDWQVERARFAVDEQTVFETPFAPRGPCGFIAWIDNQYAVVTPQGRFGFGLVPVPHEQTLTLEQLRIDKA